MEPDPKQRGEQKVLNLQLKLDEEMAQGRYSNFAVVNHTPTEFLLDFIFMQPNQPVGKVLSRIIVSPTNARRVLAALQENVARYEARFGPIALLGDKPPETVIN